MADREAPKSKGAGGKGHAKDPAPSQSKQQLAFDPNHTRGFYQRGTAAPAAQLVMRRWVGQRGTQLYSGCRVAPMQTEINLAVSAAY